MLCGKPHGRAEPPSGSWHFFWGAFLLQQLLLTLSFLADGNSYESGSFSGLPLTCLVSLFWLVEVSVLIKSDIKNRARKVAQWVKCLLHTHEVVSSNPQHSGKRMDVTLLFREWRQEHPKCFLAV